MPPRHGGTKHATDFSPPVFTIRPFRTTTSHSTHPACTMTALRTQRRRDENTLPGDKRRTDTTLNPKKPSKRDALKPSKQNDENAPLKPRSAALDKSKSKSAPSPPKKRPLQPSTSQLKTSSGSGSRVREALASLQPQSQQPRRDSPTLNALYKTPAGQIGAAGRARVAALDRVRPVVLRGGSTGGRGNGVSGVAGAGAVPGEKGKEKRKIQVMPDELSAGFSAIGE